MNETKDCAVCGRTMKLIPSGVSKTTGKPYNAFWACPEKCKQPQMSSTSQINHNKIADIKEEEKWKRINEEKNGNIKWLNALNNACLLASTDKISLKDLKVTAQRIYEMYPIGTPENKIKPAELPVIQQFEEQIDLNKLFEN